MKNSWVVIVCIVVGWASNCFAGRVVKLGLQEVESVVISRDISCFNKVTIVEIADESVWRELYDRLGEKNNLVCRARERHQLMNIAFAYEGNHEWGRDDDRSMQLLKSEWLQAMDPLCFNGKTDGLSSEEWLKGAVWAMQNRNLTIKK